MKSKQQNKPKRTSFKWFVFNKKTSVLVATYKGPSSMACLAQIPLEYVNDVNSYDCVADIYLPKYLKNHRIQFEQGDLFATPI